MISIGGDQKRTVRSDENRLPAPSFVCITLASPKFEDIIHPTISVFRWYNVHPKSAGRRLPSVKGASMEQGIIPFLSATELSGLIKKREISATEAVSAYLERIDTLDDKLNAYLTVCRDEALEAASKADVAIACGEYIGPMHGIPVAVKDQIYTKGVRTTGGSTIFSELITDYDATVVSKLKDAGAILLGKLNMAELGSTGFSHAFKMPRNPWDLERHPGGSSSGPGAATAGFLCATSLGEDTGGSIRWPSAWCGLVGLKPTNGRVSRYGLMRGVWFLDTAGPMSRTVQDCAMTLQAIAGYDPKDAYTWDTPVPDYSRGLNGDIKGKRIGVITEQINNPAVQPETREAVLKAVSVLGGLGASIEEVSIPLSVHMFTLFGAVEAPFRYRKHLKSRMNELGHDNRISHLTWFILPAQSHYKAQKLQALLRQQVLDALDKVDVLALPTSGVPAEKVGPEPIIDSKEAAAVLPFLLTPVFSLAGTPALSICCGFTSENLPIGLQLAGRPMEEDTLLKVAYAYEQANSWHTRRPPID